MDTKKQNPPRAGHGNRPRHGQARHVFVTVTAPVLTVAAIGVGGLILAASDAESFGSFAQLLGCGILVCSSAAVCGGVLGFLFALPRTLDSNRDQASHIRSYQANTNLEEISDWLTKIIVGLGIAKLTSLPGLLSSLVTYLSNSLGYKGAEAILLLLILLYVTLGFLCGYLTTRLRLEAAYYTADAGVASARASLEPPQESSRDREVEADRLAAGGKYAEAVRRYLDAYRLDQTSMVSLQKAADIARDHLDNATQACIYYHMILLSRPRNAQALYGLATSEAILGNTEAAKVHLDAAIDSGGPTYRQRATLDPHLAPLVEASAPDGRWRSGGERPEGFIDKGTNDQ